MFNGIFHIPQPVNEPCLQYAPGSPERSELSAKLKEMLNNKAEIPMIIDDQEVRIHIWPRNSRKLNNSL